MAASNDYDVRRLIDGEVREDGFVFAGMDLVGVGEAFGVGEGFAVVYYGGAEACEAGYFAEAL